MTHNDYLRATAHPRWLAALAAARAAYGPLWQAAWEVYASEERRATEAAYAAAMSVCADAQVAQAASAEAGEEIC